MKKYSKILSASLILALVVSMYGCFGSGEKQTSDSNTQAYESESGIQTESAMSEVPIELYTVEIKQETVENETYTANLIYPQITGYSDREIEEKVNALIYSYVSKKMNTSIAQTGAASGINYSIESFNVTYKGDKFISALCRGSVYVEGNAYTTGFAYGINIDFTGAKLVGFDSIVDYNGFKTGFTSGEFKLTRGYEKLLDETNFSDMISQYDPLYSIYPEFYVKQTENGINLGVITDTIHVLGDVAEFEASVEGQKYMTDYFKDLTNAD